MAKSTYYYELSKTDAVQERNAPKESEIQVIFTQHKGRYGVRRVYAALANRGFAVNHKRVQRIMDLKNFMIPLLFSRQQLLNTLITTTMTESNEKQNGCLLLNSEKHP